MKILRASDYKRMSWKNGGGETAEIAVFPPDAPMDEFGWRVSMATVSSSGPFSIFHNVDRTLSILDGEGMSLSINNRPPLTLTQKNAPYPFGADEPVTAILSAGTVIDLNIMTRRHEFMHSVDVIRQSQDISITGQSTTFILAVGELKLFSNILNATLNHHDSIMILTPSQLTIKFTTEISRAYLCTIKAVGSL